MTPITLPRRRSNGGEPRAAYDDGAVPVDDAVRTSWLTAAQTGAALTGAGDDAGPRIVPG
ncbi:MULTISPECIES: hypothetical protein [unclassified Arthrobacter]|uniref:hypothetical protein n=1 Tax=unclassified Arthrobacter TaxID=235627 RepID=UPI0011B07CD7|nr:MULTISPECIES: hypothetical protein [unclassified Arthrobacter]